MRTHRRAHSLGVFALFALVIAACGSSTESDVDASSPAQTVEETAETPTETSTIAPTPTTAPSGISCDPTTIETGTGTISAERCAPAAADQALQPAVVVLNGCGGYDADGEVTSAISTALAERGVIALRVDFLAAEPAPPDTYCDAGAVIGAVQPLLQAIVDSVAALRADPAVDPDRVGAAGYSLGALGVMGAELGGAGLTTVTPLELSAAALLSYPTGLPGVLEAAREGDLPPLFLMTGEDDTVAPPAGALALADAATEGGVPVELVLVPSQDHPWRGEAAILASEAIADYLAQQLGA